MIQYIDITPEKKELNFSKQLKNVLFLIMNIHGMIFLFIHEMFHFFAAKLCKINVIDAELICRNKRTLMFSFLFSFDFYNVSRFKIILIAAFPIIPILIYIGMIVMFASGISILGWIYIAFLSVVCYNHGMLSKEDMDAILDRKEIESDLDMLEEFEN